MIWDTGTEIPAPELIHNVTKKHNKTAEAKYWTKTDPMYAKILTPKTCLYKLEKDKTSVLENPQGELDCSEI